MHGTGRRRIEEEGDEWKWKKRSEGEGEGELLQEEAAMALCGLILLGFITANILTMMVVIGECFEFL